MRLYTAESLVLDVRDLADADRIVTFLARGLGKKAGVARGAKRKHSRYAGQLQPAAKVVISWAEKPGRELVRISSVELVRFPKRLHAELEGLLLLGYLGEQVREFVQENEPAELYFRLLDSTLDALEAGVDRDLAARFFETWVLRLAGIFPPPLECPLCARPLVAGATLPTHGDSIVCPECGGPGADKVPPEVVDFLLATGHRRLLDLATTPPGPAVLRGAEAIAAQVRRAFLQKELGSYRVLAETLRSLGER